MVLSVPPTCLCLESDRQVVKAIMSILSVREDQASANPLVCLYPSLEVRWLTPALDQHADLHSDCVNNPGLNTKNN